MAPGPVTMPAYAQDQRLNRPGAPVTSRSPQLTPRLADYTGRTVIPGLRPEHLLAAAGGPTGPALFWDAAWPRRPAQSRWCTSHRRPPDPRRRGTDVGTDAATVSGEGVVRVDAKTRSTLR